MISVDIREKRFGDTMVLGRMSFEIEPGESVALVGPSGIGKSTLLRIVAGIDTAFEGSIIRPNHVAIVFQEPTLLPWRSSLDNLRIVHPALGIEQARHALAQVGLAGKEQHFPGQLSLGQQRRLALARAFCGEPEFLIMDEPFVSLDLETADAMLSLTEDLIARHAPAMLFVTHERGEAERLAERILTMSGGASGAVLEQQPQRSNAAAARPAANRE